LFLLIVRLQRISQLFPYTTLFRSEYAKKFSNIPESFQSSLGFYATAEPYYGKHGYSLRLDGLEKGINDKARERAIVIHGADYVRSEEHTSELQSRENLVCRLLLEK